MLPKPSKPILIQERKCPNPICQSQLVITSTDIRADNEDAPRKFLSSEQMWDPIYRVTCKKCGREFTVQTKFIPEKVKLEIKNRYQHQP